jgi:hypothetical protein
MSRRWQMMIWVSNGKRRANSARRLAWTDGLPNHERARHADVDRRPGVFSSATSFDGRNGAMSADVGRLSAEQRGRLQTRRWPCPIVAKSLSTFRLLDRLT